jgi:hypothetical protein
LTATVNGVPDWVGQGYYTPSREFVSGLPPTTENRNFIHKPLDLTYGEVDELHEFCVEQLNKYRSGQVQETLLD